MLDCITNAIYTDADVAVWQENQSLGLDGSDGLPLTPLGVRHEVLRTSGAGNKVRRDIFIWFRVTSLHRDDARLYWARDAFDFDVVHVSAPGLHPTDEPLSAHEIGMARYYVQRDSWGHDAARAAICSWIDENEMSAPALRLVRIREVLHQTGLSRATLYRLMQAGQFPQRVALTPGCVAWREDEVAAWIKGRAAK